MFINIKLLLTLLLAFVVSLSLQNRLQACTGITIKAADGAVVFGRTLEWGCFDLKTHLVIEFLQGKQVIFDNPFGVVTNAPSFDWHLTNLLNYIDLSPVALPGKKIENLNFTPLGGGSGMIGQPGDFIRHPVSSGPSPSPKPPGLRLTVLRPSMRSSAS